MMLVTLILISAFSFGVDLQLANIGFMNEDIYISVRPDDSEKEILYEFSYCKTSTGECFKISECSYTESSLKKEVEKIESKNIQNDFEWIFLSSGYSSEGIVEFTSEFKNLLKRANPNCIKIFLPNEVFKG